MQSNRKKKHFSRHIIYHIKNHRPTEIPDSNIYSIASLKGEIKEIIRMMLGILEKNKLKQPSNPVLYWNGVIYKRGEKGIENIGH